MKTSKETIAELNKGFDFEAFLNPTEEQEAKIKNDAAIFDEKKEQEEYASIMKSYSMDVKLAKNLKTCKRCNGEGVIKSYRHVANGVCFTCGGYGKR